MAMTIHCDIVSAEEAIFSGLAEMVVAHGTLGDLGIVYGHAPLLTALKPDAQITRVPTVYLPDPPTAEHFVALWQRKPFGAYLGNSAWIGVCATLLSVSLAALAAAPLARMRGRGREAVLLGFLLFAAFPPILLLFPIYEAVRALGWLNQPLALILPYAALNLPLSESFALRVAGTWRDQGEGIMANLANGDSEPRSAHEAFRLSAAWLPSDRLSLAMRHEQGSFDRDGHIFEVYKHVDGHGAPWPNSIFTGVDDGRLDLANGAPFKYRDAFLGTGRYIGHFVGISVHDVGGISGHWLEKPFVAGVVFNVEPILQFPERKIHIRLEDTVVLTEKGAENLTAGVPAEVEPLYALIKEKGVNSTTVRGQSSAAK